MEGQSEEERGTVGKKGMRWGKEHERGKMGLRWGKKGMRWERGGWDGESGNEMGREEQATTATVVAIVGIAVVTVRGSVTKLVWLIQATIANELIILKQFGFTSLGTLGWNPASGHGRPKPPKNQIPFSKPPPTEIAKTSKRRKIQFVKFRSVTGNEKTQKHRNQENYGKISRRFEAFRGRSVSRRTVLREKSTQNSQFWHVSLVLASISDHSPEKIASILACLLWFCSVSVTFLSGKRERNFEAFRGVSRHFEGALKSPKLKKFKFSTSFVAFQPKIKHFPSWGHVMFVCISPCSEHSCLAPENPKVPRGPTLKHGQLWGLRSRNSNAWSEGRF